MSIIYSYTLCIRTLFIFECHDVFTTTIAVILQLHAYYIIYNTNIRFDVSNLQKKKHIPTYDALLLSALLQFI